MMPDDDLTNIPRADGYTECRFCRQRPTAGEPWTELHIATTILYQVCLDCWLAHDNGTRPHQEPS